MGYEGDFGRRVHKPRHNILCFYYPQATKDIMGPTAVVLGGHYLSGPMDHRRLSAGGRRAAVNSEQGAGEEKNSGLSISSRKG